MRLSTKELAIIKEKSRLFFGKESKVYLFGSRVNDSERGGDIDLYIIPPQPLSADKRFEKKIDLLVDLKCVLGDQKIDLLIAKEKASSIEKEALQKGVLL